ILDGGLPKWAAEGRPVTDDPTPPRERHFTARLDNTLVRSLDDVKALVDGKREQIVDARAANRFRGEAPEPRPGLRAGHMPGAYNVPYPGVLENGRLASAEKLAAAFAAGRVDVDEPIVTSCGPGRSPAILTLASD